MRLVTRDILRYIGAGEHLYHQMQQSALQLCLRHQCDHGYGEEVKDLSERDGQCIFDADWKDGLPLTMARSTSACTKDDLFA